MIDYQQIPVPSHISQNLKTIGANPLRKRTPLKFSAIPVQYLKLS